MAQQISYAQEMKDLMEHQEVVLLLAPVVMTILTH
jgi:hypothetical protein